MTPTTDYKVKQFKLVTLTEAKINYKADGPELCEKFFREVMAKDERYTGSVETFQVIFLNTRRRVTGWQMISQGTLDTLLVHPREVFRAAILHNAAAIVLFHNHPSGDPSPSEADTKVTRDLIRAGQILKIEVLDHIIIGEPDAERPKGYVSLRELGYFY